MFVLVYVGNVGFYGVLEVRRRCKRTDGKRRKRHESKRV